MNPRRPARVPMGIKAAAAAAVVLLAAGCSSGSKKANPPATTGGGGTAGAGGGTGSAQIDIRNFDFGAPITVTPGTKITIKDSDSSPHTVTAKDGTFNVNVSGGATATLTAPTKPGTYEFFCTLHPFMKHSTITVR